MRKICIYTEHIFCTVKSLFVFLFVFIFLVGCIDKGKNECSQNTEDYTKKIKIGNSGLNSVEVGIFFCELKQAIVNDDKLKVAQLVRFPVEASIKGEYVVVKGKNEFLKNYDEIINQKVKEMISNQTIDGLTSDWQGVDLGEGIVWINKVSDRQLIFARKRILIIQFNNGGLHKITGESNYEIEYKKK